MITSAYLRWYAGLFVLTCLGIFVLTCLAAIAFEAVRDGIGAGDIVFALFFAAVFPALWIWLMRMMGFPVGKPMSCPRCGTEMPMLRMPRTTKQALWGGFTCPNCGAEMDRQGREISTGAAA